MTNERKLNAKKAYMLESFLERSLELEMDVHLGYYFYSHIPKENENRRNGTSRKKIHADVGTLCINIPRDRHASFSPICVKKYTTQISQLEHDFFELLESDIVDNQIDRFLSTIYNQDILVDIGTALHQVIKSFHKDYQCMMTKIDV